MQFSTDTMEPRKRRRTAKSCEQCRHRKVGCDQAHPCGPCRRSRDHLICTYRDSTSSAPIHAHSGSHTFGNGPDAPGTTPARSYPHQTSRFEVLATGVAPVTRASANQDNVHKETDDQSSQSRIRADAGRTADEMIQKLEERIQRLEAEARNRHRGRDDNVTRTTLSVSATTAPRLRFTKGKVKLFAQSHWVHTAEKVCF